MRERDGVWRTGVAYVVAGAGLVVAAALFAAGHGPGPAWVTASAGALFVALAVPGKRAIEAWGTRWAEPVEQMARRSTARSALLGRGQRVADSKQWMALSIHTAIPLPADADPDLSGSLPQYIPREADADIHAWLNSHTKTGGLIVLVGDAAAGKTRCLYEALIAEVADW
ncbi:hypothetical protein OG788_02400 [Streptomyces sp. NBC_00647]|uniref:hypothetical protein n=1 Tax=Streptomyces sp. NBC_00647 TaxID=2975796 RepID=UPI003253B63C